MLRRAYFHLRCNYHSKCAGGSLLTTRPYAKSLFTSSHFISSHKTIESSLQISHANTTLLPRCTSNSLVPLLQAEYFSSSEEGEGSNSIKPKSQSIDYETILTRRGEDIDKSASISREKESAFSSYAKSTPHLLHSPKKFLFNAFRTQNVKRRNIDTFDVQVKNYEAKFYSATFTDPITNEVFHSGLGTKVNVAQHPTVSLGTPFHLAEARILDGKVYYRTKKIAEHAAAARAIDCYIFREERESSSMIDIGAYSEKFKLCLEDPYESETERDAQQVDYEALLAKRGSYVSEEQSGTQPGHEPQGLLS